jgi:hypothetical protein
MSAPKEVPRLARPSRLGGTHPLLVLHAGDQRLGELTIGLANHRQGINERLGDAEVAVDPLEVGDLFDQRPPHSDPKVPSPVQQCSVRDPILATPHLLLTDSSIADDGAKARRAQPRTLGLWRRLLEGADRQGKGVATGVLEEDQALVDLEQHELLV